jgi:glycosyltransferase involved in cell wall biosynthesis
LFPRVSVLFLTDALGVVRRRPGFPGIRPVRDPALPDPQPARARPAWLPAPTGGATVVGVFGVISPRKNVPLLVAAAERMDTTLLVVAGRLEAPVRAFLNSDPAARRLASAGRLLVVDRLLDADELAAGLAHVDLVGVLHDNDSPSGILAEACLRHTPVLVPTGGWLAQVVESTGIGTVTDPTPEAVAAAIRAVVSDREHYVAATRLGATRINVDHFTTQLVGS